MPEKPLSPRDIQARVMEDGKKTLVPHLAALLNREGITEVLPAEERRRFWQRAMTPEQEQEVWVQEMAQAGITQLVPGAPETIELGLRVAATVYPDRFDMLAQEGRDTPSAQAAWAMKHARRGPPTPKPRPAPTTPAVAPESEPPTAPVPDEGEAS